MKTAMKSTGTLEIPTWKLVGKLTLLAGLCIGICYVFAVGVSTLASLL